MKRYFVLFVATLALALSISAAVGSADPTPNGNNCNGVFRSLISSRDVGKNLTSVYAHGDEGVHLLKDVACP